MWIFTETGFVSAVRKVDAPSKITARARDIQSLSDLAALADSEIIATPYADYGFRVLVSDDVFKAWLDTTVDMLDYDNFKNRVLETRGEKFHDALGEVWVSMHAVIRNSEGDSDE